MEDTFKITTAQYVKLNYQHSEIQTRIFALFTDRFIQFLILLFFIYIDIEHDFLSYFIYTLIYTMNLFIEYFSHGQTLGKMLFKIKVISNNCMPPTFLQCFLRWLIYPIDTWVIGLVLISKKGQRLGDMASGCYVVCKKNKSSVNVNMEEDYMYIKSKYKPKFAAVKDINKKDIDLAVKALYDQNYIALRDEITKALKKKLNIKSSLTGKEFLLQLTNDYNYYRQLD